MKTYIFDRSTNMFHDSVRGAERELGKTAAQIGKDSQIVFLTHSDVSTAIAQYIKGKYESETGKEARSGNPAKKATRKENDLHVGRTAKKTR